MDPKHYYDIPHPDGLQGGSLSEVCLEEKLKATICEHKLFCQKSKISTFIYRVSQKKISFRNVA